MSRSNWGLKYFFEFHQVNFHILGLEAHNLFGDLKINYFDPDRHAGNYRIKIENGIVYIAAFDFGQFKYVTKSQREDIYRLFALSQFLNKAGARKIIVSEIAKILGLNATDTSRLKKNLQNYFPHENKVEVFSYYALLSALRDFGIKLPRQYADFVRSITYLTEYEEEIKKSKTSTSVHQIFKHKVTEAAGNI